MSQLRNGPYQRSLAFRAAWWEGRRRILRDRLAEHHNAYPMSPPPGDLYRAWLAVGGLALELGIAADFAGPEALPIA